MSVDDGAASDRVTDLGEQAQRLMAAIPADGSAIGNTRLLRRLRWKWETYIAIRNDLVQTGLLRLGRGRGGSVSRTALSIDPSESEGSGMPYQALRIREVDLYPGFMQSLRTWAEDQGWNNFLAREIAHQGRRRTGGTWTRPDFLVVGYKKFEYTPGTVRDVETFEVKPHDAGIESVFETAAHSRVATKSYLAVETSLGEIDDELFDRIAAECQRFGLGLVYFKHNGSFDDWEFRIEPVRSEPDPADVEQFIQDQVPAADQVKIRTWLR